MTDASVQAFLQYYTSGSSSLEEVPKITRPDYPIPVESETEPANAESTLPFRLSKPILDLPTILVGDSRLTAEPFKGSSSATEELSRIASELPSNASSDSFQPSQSNVHGSVPSFDEQNPDTYPPEQNPRCAGSVKSMDFLDTSNSDNFDGIPYRPFVAPTSTPLADISHTERTEAMVRQHATEIPQLYAWIITAKMLKHWKTSFNVKEEDSSWPPAPKPLFADKLADSSDES